MISTSERTPLTSEKRRDPKKRLLEDLVSAEISLNKMDTFTKVFSCAPSSSRPIDPGSGIVYLINSL